MIMVDRLRNIIFVDSVICEKCGELSPIGFTNGRYNKWPIPCSREFIGYPTGLYHVEGYPPCKSGCNGQLMFSFDLEGFDHINILKNAKPIGYYKE